MRPNRVRVYDAESIAVDLRETFTAKKSKEYIRLPFSWPRELQYVGHSLAVMYSSDKWREDGDLELYKHIAESRNRVLMPRGFLRDRNNSAKAIPTIGPMISFANTPMPKHFALLAYFEGIDVQIHTHGDDDNPKFGTGDEGIVEVTVGHAYLGASNILWSQDGKKRDQPFLFVYTEKHGPLIIVIGDELDIEADGIVG